MHQHTSFFFKLSQTVIVFIRLKSLTMIQEMLIPVRCFTCGGLIADKYTEYSNRVRTGEDPAKVMDSLGVKRYCCRRMFISNVDTIYQIIPYYEALRRRMFEIQSDIE
jgi:DNA-directed RNA polymerase subunit N